MKKKERKKYESLIEGLQHFMKEEYKIEYSITRDVIEVAPSRWDKNPSAWKQFKPSPKISIHVTLSK